MEIELKPIVTGLEFPVAIEAPDDGTGRLFIVQHRGKVLVYDAARLLERPFLDIGGLLSEGNDRGLVSLAFHPQYRSNGFFYVFYTDKDGAGVLARYRVSSDPNIADVNSASVMLSIPLPSTIHMIDHLDFGPDGFLYLSVGDGGHDKPERAQDLGLLLGKILRIDVDSAFPYAVPATNPFLGQADARPEIWAYGLRNPWTFSFDRVTGDLFIGDVGDDRREEVNFQPVGSPGGENYGWPLMEGTSCFMPAQDCNDGTLTLPILEYEHRERLDWQDCTGSVTGGHRYRGERWVQLRGSYFYGDFCDGRLWAGRETEGGWEALLLVDTDYFFSAFGEDEEGELYVADYLGGSVYRIDVVNTSVPTLTSLRPSRTAAGGGALEVVAEGNDFAPGATMLWNGQQVVSTVVSYGRLQATVPSNLLTRGGQVSIQVVNPAPGGGASNTLTFTVADFLLQVTPPQVTVKRGQSATLNLLVEPEFGPFDRSVSLGCTGLPAGWRCEFSPEVVVPGDVPATAMLRITSEKTAWYHRDNFPASLLALFLAALMLPVRNRLKASQIGRRLGAGAIGVLLGCALLGYIGCSGPNTLPTSQTHEVTVIGSSGSRVNAVTVSLTIQE